MLYWSEDGRLVVGHYPSLLSLSVANDRKLIEGLTQAVGSYSLSSASANQSPISLVAASCESDAWIKFRLVFVSDTFIQIMDIEEDVPNRDGVLTSD